MKRIRTIRDARHGNRLTITMGGVEHVMTVREAADLAAEIQLEVVMFVNGTVQLALDHEDSKTWRERATEALRKRGICGPQAARDFLAGVMKVYSAEERMLDPRYCDIKEDDDALAFASNRELEILVRKHGVEVEGSP